MKSPNGITPLYAAAIKGHNGIIDFQRSQGVDIDDRLHGGETPLMAAVGNGQVETVDLLLRTVGGGGLTFTLKRLRHKSLPENPVCCGGLQVSQ